MDCSVKFVTFEYQLPFAAQNLPFANVWLLGFSGLGFACGCTGRYLVSFSEPSVTPAGIFLGKQQKPQGNSLSRVCMSAGAQCLCLVQRRCRALYQRGAPVRWWGCLVSSWVALGFRSWHPRCPITATDTSDPWLRLPHRLFSDKTVIWIRFLRAQPPSKTSLRSFDTWCLQSSHPKLCSEDVFTEHRASARELDKAKLSGTAVVISMCCTCCFGCITVTLWD